MPTGYTAKLYEGEQSFEEFVWGCARAFAALVTLRDEPLGSPIPREFVADRHYSEKLSEARMAVAELESMPIDEADQQAAIHNRDEQEKYHERLTENAAMLARYKDMLARVRAWTPPSPEHKELKNFMCKQLQESIDFDCYEPEAPALLSGAQWRAMQLAISRRNLEYYEREGKKEEERARSRTEWVQALAKSLEEK